MTANVTILWLIDYKKKNKTLDNVFYSLKAK